MSRFQIKVQGLKQVIQALNIARPRVRRAVEIATAQEAHLLRRVMVEGLRDQAPGGTTIKGLRPMTILMRGLPKAGTKMSKHGKLRRMSTKALIHGGDLIRSINVRGGGMHYTVGVHRGAAGRTGQDIQRIAEVHEYGTRTYSVKVTEKMRRFSFVLMNFGILKAPWKVGSVFRIKIPARPFIHPAWDVWVKDVADRFALTVQQHGGSLLR